MGFTNFWPKEAQLFENDTPVGVVHYDPVTSCYKGSYPPHLVKFHVNRLLWIKQSFDAKERHDQDGEILGIDMSNVRYDLTILPGPFMSH